MSGLLILTKEPCGEPQKADERAFFHWLSLFIRVTQGRQYAVYPLDAWFPREVAQRRMIHRLALSYARAVPGSPWPLGGGLAPAPARGPTDFLGTPVAPGLGLGSPAPLAVLVGDRPQPGAARWADRLGWPFISGLRTGCSSWLAEQLEDACIPEEQLFWVNGWTNEGKINVSPLQHAVFQLKPLVVVALGAQARKALEAIGYMQYEEVHHPQYWKRFHSKEKYHLKKILRRYLRDPS